MAGVALIEALIGMLLVALWLLSSAGLQVSSLKFQSGAASRFTAVALASELGERMEANARGVVNGAYALAATTTPTATQFDCTQIACAPDDMAEYDLSDWSTRVVANIKQLQSISIVDATPAGGLTTYTITISWNEPKGRQAYEAGANATTETMSYVMTKVVRNATV